MDGLIFGWDGCLCVDEDDSSMDEADEEVFVDRADAVPLAPKNDVAALG